MSGGCLANDCHDGCDDFLRLNLECGWRLNDTHHDGYGGCSPLPSRECGWWVSGGCRLMSDCHDGCNALPKIRLKMIRLMVNGGGWMMSDCGVRLMESGGDMRLMIRLMVNGGGWMMNGYGVRLHVLLSVRMDHDGGWVVMNDQPKMRAADDG